MNRIVKLRSDGGEEEVLTWDQKDLHTLLGGAVTFVGAIDDLKIVAVGRTDGVFQENPWCKNPAYFDTPVLGDVLLVYSDEQGEPGDVDLNTLDEWLLINRPSLS